MILKSSKLKFRFIGWNVFLCHVNCVTRRTWLLSVCVLGVCVCEECWGRVCCSCVWQAQSGVECRKGMRAEMKGKIPYIFLPRDLSTMLSWVHFLYCISQLLLVWEAWIIRGEDTVRKPAERVIMQKPWKRFHDFCGIIMEQKLGSLCDLFFRVLGSYEISS